MILIRQCSGTEENGEENNLWMEMDWAVPVFGVEGWEGEHTEDTPSKHSSRLPKKWVEVETPDFTIVRWCGALHARTCISKSSIQKQYTTSRKEKCWNQIKRLQKSKRERGDEENNTKTAIPSKVLKWRRLISEFLNGFTHTLTYCHLNS